MKFFENYVPQLYDMIIIPTYNERNNIPRLLEGIRKFAGNEPVLFVDDNSPDGTAREIELAAQTDPNITLISRPGKYGLGSAYRQAIKQILGDGAASYIITMDADMSHDPAELLHFLELVKLHPVVVGSRYVPGGRVEHWHLLRRLISRWGNIYAKLLTRVPVDDLTSGYVAYQTDWLKRANVSDLRSEGYAYQIELKYRVHAAGAQIYEHPITFVEREGGKSKFSKFIVLEGMWLPLKIFMRRIIKINP